jgi:hypothetical protein
VLFEIFFLLEEKYICCSSDHCIFNNADFLILILIYVDDVIISGASDGLTAALTAKL